METFFETIGTDKIEMKMTIKMRLGEWKELQSQLKVGWPSSKFSTAIQDLIYHAEKHFYPSNT